MLPHLPHQVTHSGPGIIYSQWPIEHTIGNVTKEAKQHSNPFSNLEQQGIQRCQVNAFKAMIPDLETHTTNLPQNAIDLDDRYALLPA